MWFEALKTLAVLLGILGLIFFLAWVLRRAGVAGHGDTGREGWRVLSIKALGPKRHIYIVEVGSHILLVGATDRSMNTLMEISSPEERERLLNAISQKEKILPSFKDFLRKAQS